MAVIRQGGSVTTSQSIRRAKPPVCWTCRERRPGEIYEFDPNGAPICATCRGEAPMEAQDADGEAAGPAEDARADQH